MNQEMCSSDHEWNQGGISLIGVLQGREDQLEEQRDGFYVEEPTFQLKEDYHLEFDLEGMTDNPKETAEPLGWLVFNEGKCSPRSDSRSTMQTASVSSKRRLCKQSFQKNKKPKSGKEHSSIESIICFREQDQDLKNEAQESKRRLTRRYIKNKLARNLAADETPDFDYLELGLESQEPQSWTRSKN